MLAQFRTPWNVRFHLHWLSSNKFNAPDLNGYFASFLYLASFRSIKNSCLVKRQVKTFRFFLEQWACSGCSTPWNATAACRR